MHSIRIHKVVALFISLFYLIGVWHREEGASLNQKRIKWFYCIYYLLFFLSLVFGAITNDKKVQSIYLAEVGITSTVVCAKLWLLSWKQNEILHLLSRVSVFPIQNDDDYNRFNDRLGGFMKFVFVFVIVVAVIGTLETVVLTFIGGEKNLFLEIAFPLDYRNSEFAFWMGFVFLFSEIILSVVVLIFTTVIWYLLLICSLRYEVLGSELKNMGRNGNGGRGKMWERQRHHRFFEDLKRSVHSNHHLRKVTNEVESIFTKAFFIQFFTSGLCICGSIYCLAFGIGDSTTESLVYLLVFLYFIAELFMITYIGNEIMLSSDRLFYSLFESDWYDQPQSIKKCIIIFGEHLKQPQVMVIGKLYPLTLESFTRILKSAYSMFNILKSFK